MFLQFIKNVSLFSFLNGALSVECFYISKTFHPYLNPYCSPVLEGNTRCVIENHGGTVTLRPLPGGVCQLNGREITEPCRLAQGQFFTHTPQFSSNSLFFSI